MVIAALWSLLKTLLSICFVLGSIAMVHEVGHFVTAKLTGIRVIEFSIGFSMGTGWRLFACKIGETVYSLRPFPLGGFVQLAGMDPSEEAEAEAENAAFDQASAPVPTAVGVGSAAEAAVGSEPPAASPAAVAGVEQPAGAAPVAAPGVVPSTCPTTPAPDAADAAGKAAVAATAATGPAPAAAAAVAGDAAGVTAVAGEAKGGETGGAAADAPLDPRGFMAKPAWAKVLVLSAGSVMNLVWAVVVFLTLYTIWGGALSNMLVASVNPGSPALTAGLKPGDIIASVAGQPLQDYQDGVRIINAHAGEEIDLRVIREHPVPRPGFAGGILRGDLAANRGTYHLSRREELTLKVTPRGSPGRGMIGIGLLPNNYDFRALPMRLSLKKALWSTWGIIEQTLNGFHRIIFGGREADVAGPVKIMQIIKDQAAKGVSDLLYLTALLSVNIGLFNLFPLPVLDGSRIIFVLLEVLFKGIDKLTGVRFQVSPRTEEGIHFVGLLLLLGLMILVTYKDIKGLMH